MARAHLYVGFFSTVNATGPRCLSWIGSERVEHEFSTRRSGSGGWCPNARIVQGSTVHIRIYNRTGAAVDHTWESRRTRSSPTLSSRPRVFLAVGGSALRLCPGLALPRPARSGDTLGEAFTGPPRRGQLPSGSCSCHSCCPPSASRVLILSFIFSDSSPCP